MLTQIFMALQTLGFSLGFNIIKILELMVRRSLIVTERDAFKNFYIERFFMILKTSLYHFLN